MSAHSTVLKSVHDEKGLTHAVSSSGNLPCCSSSTATVERLNADGYFSWKCVNKGRCLKEIVLEIQCIQNISCVVGARAN